MLTNSSCISYSDYSGALIDGTEFDSSYKRGQPLTFAPNQVIKWVILPLYPIHLYKFARMRLHDDN